VRVNKVGYSRPISLPGLAAEEGDGLSAWLSGETSDVNVTMADVIVWDPQTVVVRDASTKLTRQADSRCVGHTPRSWRGALHRRPRRDATNMG
jgi:hypothetical protein